MILLLFIFLINTSLSTPDLQPFPERVCFHGWKEYDNYDIWGYDLTFAPANIPEDCFVLCENRKDCYGFTYAEAFIGFRCYFKTEGATQVIPNNDVYSAYRCGPRTTIPPEKEYYEEWWFYVIIVISMALIIFIILFIHSTRKNIKQIQEQNQWQEDFKKKMGIKMDIEMN